MRNVFGGEPAARSRTILDHHRLADHVGEFLSDEARENVVAAAGSKADHDADRPGRIIALRVRASEAQQHHRQKESQRDEESAHTAGGRLRSLHDVIHSTSAWFTACGCSSVDKWPEPGMMTRREPGIPAAISRDNSGGVPLSCSPTRTRVGQAMAAESGRESGRAMIASLVPKICLRAGFFRHAQHDGLERRVAVTIGVHEEGKAFFGDFGKTPAFCLFHRRPPALGLFRSLRPRTGVEERQLRHPLRRLPHDLEGDVTAHRQPREREARRRCGKDAAGNRRHGVVAPMIRDRDRAEPPQRRNLLGVKARRTIQAGDQDDRQAGRRSYRASAFALRLPEKVKHFF